MFNFIGSRLFDCLLLICILALATATVAVLPDSLPGPVLRQADLDRLLDHLDPAALQKHLRYLAAEALEGRRTGTQGEDLAGFYLARTLQQYRLSPWETAGLADYLQPFAIPIVAGQALTAENVIGYWPGQNADQYLLITAHYDGSKSGQSHLSDNSAAVAMALEWGHCLSASGLRPKRTVVLAFTSENAQEAAGSAALAAQLTERGLRQNIICLDLVLPASAAVERLSLTDAQCQSTGDASALARRLQAELSSSGQTAPVQPPAADEPNQLLTAGPPAIRLQAEASASAAGTWTSEQLAAAGAVIFRLTWVMANW